MALPTLYSLEDASGQISNVFMHIGQITLALLAHFRYTAVRDPMEYDASKVRSWKLICAACLVVVAVNGLPLVGNILIHHSIISYNTDDIFSMVGAHIEIIYLSACLFV